MLDIDFSNKDLGRVLSSILVISKESLIEQSSKAGSYGRDAIRVEFRKSSTQWKQEYTTDKNGRKRRVLTKKNMARYKLGKRISHQNQGEMASPASMENFITSFTMETTGTTVIGGTHKSFRPNKIRNGKIVGTLGRVGGVSQQTIAILEKLNYGRRGKYGDKLAWYNGKESIKQFENKWKPRGFIEAGWNNARGRALESMTTELQNLIATRANNENLTQGVKSAI